MVALLFPVGSPFISIGFLSKSFKGAVKRVFIQLLIPMVMPLALLEKSIDKRVSLLLKDNRTLEGKLTGYDDYMNMVLEDTEERTSEQERRLGTVILRGNNVVSISPV